MGMVLGMLLTGIGSWIRVGFKFNVYLALGGQFLAAIGQPFLLNAPAKVSNIWFKPESVRSQMLHSALHCYFNRFSRESSWQCTWIRDSSHICDPH